MDSTFGITTTPSPKLSAALLAIRIASALAFLYHGAAITFGAFGGPGPEKFAAFTHMPLIAAYLVGLAQLGEQLVEALVPVQPAPDLVDRVGVGGEGPWRAPERDGLNAPRGGVVEVDEVHQDVPGLPLIDPGVRRPARSREIRQGVLHDLVQIGKRHVVRRQRAHQSPLPL